MNLIEKLLQRIQKRLPEVQAKLDPPMSPEKPWWLDLTMNGHSVEVEWRPERGFGVSAGDSFYGEGHDEVYTRLEQVETRLYELLEDQKNTRPPHSVLVRRLRELRGMTQEQLASRLGIQQSSVSRLERSDMYLSTLHRLVASMGGQLKMQAVFPDGVISLDDCPPVTKRQPGVPPSKKPRKRSAAGS